MVYLTKAWDMMDWINEQTPWSKKCQKIDQKMHKRASIVVNKDGVQTEIGYKSEIIGVSLKNDPQKARGKKAKLILRLATDTYDVVICGQTFEHAEFFWLTMVEMVRVLKQGGLLCLIVPCNYGTHRCPVDCYRFNADSMVALARYVSLNILHADTNCAPAMSPIEKPYLKWWYGIHHVDTMLIAHKPYPGVTKVADPATYECIPMDLGVLRTGLIPYNSYIANKKFYKILGWLRNIFKRDPY